MLGRVPPVAFAPRRDPPSTPDPALQVALAPRPGWGVVGVCQVLQVAFAPRLDLVVSVDQALPLVPSTVPVVGLVPSDPVPDVQVAIAPRGPAPPSLAAR